jgi:hypothetical protein
VAGYGETRPVATNDTVCGKIVFQKMATRIPENGISKMEKTANQNP